MLTLRPPRRRDGRPAPAGPSAPAPATRRRRRAGLGRDARGGATAAIAVLAAGAVLTLGLVADVGRAYSERARLQAWLDGVALAAAAQLDGRPDALERAGWAADNAVPAVGGAFSDPAEAPFAVAERLYLSALPEGGIAGRGAGALAPWATSDPAEARFVWLRAAPRSLVWTGLRLLKSGGDAFGLSARAAARPLPRPDCGAPVIAVCAPEAGPDALAVPGAQLRLSRNRDAAWAPGEYGVVADIGDDAAGTCSGLTGTARQACLMAIDAPSSLCPPAVDVSAGGALRVADPLNTRFDGWAGDAAALVGTAGVSSDANTITGAPRACDGSWTGAPSPALGLPDDPCFHRGDCDWISPPVTTEALALYWRRAHGGALPAGPATRAGVYLHEILTGTLDPAGPEDSTAPQCNPSAAPRAQRRMIRAAVVDCAALEGTEIAQAPVTGHLRALLTAPVPAAAAYVATFDGPHQGETMIPGDIVSQAPGPGNPGNHKDVGAAGENPNGQPNWGSGARGMSDAEDGEGPIWAAEDLRVEDSRRRMTYDPYRAQGLMRIGVKQSRAARAPAWKHVPMLFNSAAPTGGDPDLAGTRDGHVLVISEDGDPGDPDDAAAGGWLIFHFDRPTRVLSLDVIDSERGGVVRIYDRLAPDPTGEFRTGADGALVAMAGGEAHDPDAAGHLAIPAMGDGARKRLEIDAEGVRTLAVFLPGSGALDDLRFSNDLTSPNRQDRLLLEPVELLPPAEAWSAVLIEE